MFCGIRFLCFCVLFRTEASVLGYFVSPSSLSFLFFFIFYFPFILSLHPSSFPFHPQSINQSINPARIGRAISRHLFSSFKSSFSARHVSYFFFPRYLVLDNLLFLSVLSLLFTCPLESGVLVSSYQSFHLLSYLISRSHITR